MDRVYLHINIPNMITIGIMMLVWYWIYGFAMKQYSQRVARAA